ncbi:MAG: NAD(P)/FAD-dependent oxidoreductase [Bacteroidales bacterium]|nr:NAD(P)/FAD-dependent oxidoreductase [Bacteroidales bacterium]
MKIAIIGAGISGLSVGCYLQMNGFETEIYEKNIHPGGLCASWKRGDFTFDGCLQWVMGSDSGSPFYGLWNELIDMPSVEFVNHDVRMDIELAVNSDRHGNKVFHLYTNINRLESYMLDIAPEDALLIKGFIGVMRTMKHYEMPPMLDNIPELQPLRKKMAMITYLPLVWQYLKWKNQTNLTFARKLSNPFLKEAFELLYDGDEQKLLILTMPLSVFDKKSAGYPIGGSMKFISHIATRYGSLGGSIHYNSPVKRIITNGSAVRGVLLENGTEAHADLVISAADWHYTVFEALEGKFVNQKILELAKNTKPKVYPSVFMVLLGVNKTYKEQPHLIKFPVESPALSPDGTEYRRMELHFYHYDPALAPKDKTIIAASLYTNNSEYWINLRAGDYDQYIKSKTQFAELILDQLDKKIPGLRQSVEVMDVVTPATYHRYTNNWMGSVQGWMPGKDILAASPVDMTLPGLSGFYFCGHWTVPGGGLPPSLKSSRDLAQRICLKNKKRFRIR